MGGEPACRSCASQRHARKSRSDVSPPAPGEIRSGAVETAPILVVQHQPADWSALWI